MSRWRRQLEAEMSGGEEMDHDTSSGVSVDLGQTETFDYTDEVIFAGAMNRVTTKAAW